MVTINRPERRNCVDSDTAIELYEAFRSFNKDDSVRVGVLYGKDGNFCAGYDLKELAKMKDVERVKQRMGREAWSDESLPVAPLVSAGARIKK